MAESSTATPTAPAPAQLSFVSNSPALTFHTDGTATTTVQLLNPGPAVAAEFKLVLLPGGQTVSANPKWTSKPSTANASGSTGVNTVSLTFHADFRTSFTGASVVVTPIANSKETLGYILRSSFTSPLTQIPASSARQAQTISLTLHRDTSATIDFLIPLIVGIVCAALFLVATLASTKKRPASVSAGSSWNFKDSWATNITTGGALVGTFLAAAGSTSTLLPGIQTSSFALLLALWGGVIVLAPLILSFSSSTAGAKPEARHVPPRPGDVHASHDPDVASHDPMVVAHTSYAPHVAEDPIETAATAETKKWTKVTVSLLLAAACATLVGVGAELATAGVIVQYATTTTLGRWVAWGGLGAVALVLLVYSVLTTRALIQTPVGEEPQSMLHVGADTSLTI